jgi:hypothetical protein
MAPLPINPEKEEEPNDRQELVSPLEVSSFAF